MNPQTKSKFQMFGAWCAIGYLILICVGWAAVAGFLFPPTSPANTAEQIQALYQADTTRIRIGMVLVMVSALVMIPFTAAMCEYIQRIEGGAGVLTYSFLLGAAGNMVLTFYPAMWWLIAAFRPERGADLIYLVNDAAWLQLLGGLTMLLAMPFAIAAAAFCDRSPQPAFPRWSGYANLWVVVLMVPDQLVFFFHGGPFAWNGLFGLWLPLAAFSVFFIVNFHCLRQAILRDRASLAHLASGPRLAT
jgi:hypothetical protein